jgi:large subunit ribosomal protein L15
MRLHKLPGFKSCNNKNQLISLSDISNHYKDGETVSIDSLVKKGLVVSDQPVKILANGDLNVTVKFSDVKISNRAKEIMQKKLEDSNK